MAPKPPTLGAARRSRAPLDLRSVTLAVAQLDEEPVRLARVHPRDVRTRAVHLHAVRPQLRHRARHVGALEADQIDALAALREELADGLAGIRRLQQLDVADARGQDGVLEAEALRGVAPVHEEAEEPREACR